MTLQLFGFVVVYSFAAYGAWTVGCKARDWINHDILDDYPSPQPDPDWPWESPKEIKAKPQPRNTRPKAPSGKTARKRGTKSGK